MGNVRSQVVKTVRSMLARRGIGLIRTDRQFGIDLYQDLRRLSRAWGWRLDVIFDVGANDGETALNSLREFPEARVYSFEPHPTTFAKLSDRISTNTRFTATNIALGAQAGELAMTVYAESSKINSLVPNAQFATRFGMAGETIKVEVSTVDQFCVGHRIERIGVLKIDTEGFEMEVLKGCLDMFERRAISFVYLEFNDLTSRPGVFGGALFPLHELLANYGFRFIAAYNDYITLEGEMFAVSNALFALAPRVPAPEAVHA